jgi:hypothetical protein
MTLEQLNALPDNVRMVQDLVNRCEAAEDKKALIVQAGMSGAVSRDEATLLISANLLETA